LNELLGRTLADLEDIALRIASIANYEPGTLPLLWKDLSAQGVSGLLSDRKAWNCAEELDRGTVAQLRRVCDHDLRRNLRRHGVNDELHVRRAEYNHLIGAMSGSHAEN
jgi:hypothetical protein